MDPKALRLRPFRVSDEHAVRGAHELMLGENFEFALRLASEPTWSSYLNRLADMRAGVNLEPSVVPGTLLIAEVAGQIVGRASVRYRLTDWLFEHGGHIGYGVLPVFRRRGFATEILRQSLIIARAAGVDRVLVVCDDDNTGSIKTIERCGGMLDPLHPHPTGDQHGRRYWID